MQTADYDYRDFQPSQASALDETLAVKFFLKERLNKTKTAEEGRPIYKELEYVDIRAPGQSQSRVCRPATHADMQRFPKHYAAFKQRIELPVEGTPLSEWPQISRSQIEEFSFLNIKTVEQMIAMSDTNASKFHGGMGLKRKASEWLDAASETKLIAEKQQLQDSVSALQAQVAELMKKRVETSEIEDSVPRETVKVVERKAIAAPKPTATPVVKAEVVDDVPLKSRRARRASATKA